MYHKVHQALAEKIIPPDLIIYLSADTDVLMQRITFRDRSYERNMERAYIHELNLAYESFFSGAHQQGSPILKLDTNHINYVQKPEDLEWVVNRIRQALKLVPFQPELPLQS